MALVWSSALEGAAEWGLRTALALTVLALGVWAVERALRAQLAPRVRVFLWSLVLIRSVMPFGVPLPVSMPEEIRAWTVALPGRAANLEADSLPGMMALEVKVESGPGSSATTGDVSNSEQAPPGTVGAPYDEPGDEPGDEPESRAWWLLSMMAAWALGAIAHAARWITADRRFRSRLFEDSEPAPGWVQTRVQHLAQRMGIARAPAVRTMSAGFGPAVLHGLARPTLCLAADELAGDPDALDAVLAHELAHHRGCDRYAMLAAAAVRSVWWFHPAVSWAAARWLQALELTRDADAIRALGAGSRVGYARALLFAAAGADPSPRRSALGLGWGSAASEAEERVRLAAVPAGVTRSARWASGAAAFSLAAAAVATAASSPMEPPVASVPSEVSIVGDGDLERRVARLEFNATDELAAVEVIAKRYGLSLVLEPGFPLHRLSAEGRDISAREALDFVVRDYTGGFWREERQGVIRLSMPAADDGKVVARKYDFSSVMEKALEGFDGSGWPKVSVEEAPEKLRTALLDTVRLVLTQTYPDEPHELTMEGSQMRLLAGPISHGMLATLIDGLRSPTPLSNPEWSMPKANTEGAQAQTRATVACILDAIADTTGYLIATHGLEDHQLERELTLPERSPPTMLFALGQISRSTQCSLRVGARSVVLSSTEAHTVRAYSAGTQPIFGGFWILRARSWESTGAHPMGSATFFSGLTMLTGVAGSAVISTKGGEHEALVLLMLAENAAQEAQLFARDRASGTGR